VNKQEINFISIRQITLCVVALMFSVSTLANHHESDDREADADKGLVLVAGATGRTGREIVSELLSKGYRVRAFVRNLDSAHEKLSADIEFAVGDVRNRESIEAALDGVTAVVSTISAAPDDPSNGPEFVDYGGVKNLVSAAVDAGATQFVLVSSRGVTQVNQRLNKMFSNILIWKYLGEEAVRNSGIAYTVIRPGGLSDEPGGEHAFDFLQGDAAAEGRIPRADVARAVVAALSMPEARNKTFELVSGDGPAPASLRDQFAVMEED
jgi:uncharacterized protein YbjT (DUF2867 family)